MKRLLIAVLASGCGVSNLDVSDGTTTADTVGYVTDDNGLDYNGCGASSLDSNGLDRNGVDRNGLDRNGLDRNGLIANAIDPTISTTFKGWFNGNATLNDKVMKYFVKCAMPAGVSIHWKNPTDNSSHIWVGALGLAPNWATTTPTATDKAWVSACMLAHINAKATPYTVSFRSPSSPSLSMTWTAAEAVGWPDREGAFWGNLFGPTIVKKACYQTWNNRRGNNVPINDATSGRACAANNLNCGLTIVGDCSLNCVNGPNLASDGYASCGAVTQTVTTFIPQFCGDGNCNAAIGETVTTCLKDCGPDASPGGTK